MRTVTAFSYTHLDVYKRQSQWALDGVRYAYTNGLISGMDDDTFRPQQTATRAQAASIISRLLDKTE